MGLFLKNDSRWFIFVFIFMWMCDCEPRGTEENHYSRKIQANTSSLRIKRDEAESCCFSLPPLSHRRESCGGGQTHPQKNTHTHPNLCPGNLLSCFSPTALPPAPFLFLPHCTDSPKHLHWPDLVPLGTGSGPLAADSIFLARIKPPNGSHSEMIYTALLYTPAPCSPLANG